MRHIRPSSDERLARSPAVLRSGVLRKREHAAAWALQRASMSGNTSAPVSGRRHARSPARLRYGALREHASTLERIKEETV